ncbi:Beta-lactamase domain-containing protein [Mycena venus]|uniref:Beta-lactamase domain-containing protein n=1 Tax=Mycena venus TaxID=2733690 RepID=A0A8H6XX05_9AGAR|nr:Beta-lactamase domain-containing protein [Mycena venus]
MILHSVVAPLLLTAALGRSSRIPRANLTKNGKVLDDQLSSLIQDLILANNFTGVSVGIFSPNGEVEFGAWGNKTETGEKIASDTIFGIGSLSKGFLSASLGILMQDFADGKNTTALPQGVTEFNWETKMHDLLPGEWKTEDEVSTREANLIDLLSHVTGLPTHDVSYSPDDSPHDLVLRMRNLRAAYELRQLWEYNNQMFVAGSYVVSKFSGMAYRDFVEKRIMLPLNMSSSTMHPDRVSGSDRFTQTWTPYGRRIPFFLKEHSADLIAGAGGVISTAEDMLLWAKLILNGGVNLETNATIIPKYTFDLVTTGHSIVTAQGDGFFSPTLYGLGWVRQAYRGHELIWHNGGAPGISSICTVYPYDGYAVVVLSNTEGPTGTEAIAYAVADHIFGLPSPSASAAPPPANSTSPEPSIAPSAAPSQTLSGLEGSYSNVAYGNFTLCSPAKATSPTSQCAGVIQDFKKLDAAAGQPSNPAELYSAWSRFWGTHLRLTPISGNDYNSTLTTLYVDGYGADHTPFEEPVANFKISFMEEKGKVVGLGFYVAENVSWRVKKGGSVRDTADAWFDKL